MKKRLFTAWLAALCCLLVGCGNNPETDNSATDSLPDSSATESTSNSSDGNGNSDSSSDGDSTSDSSGDGQDGDKLIPPYQQANLASVVFTDCAKSITVDVSANTYLQELLLGTEYFNDYADHVEINPDAPALYTLDLQDVSLSVYEQSCVKFNLSDGSVITAWTADGALDYLATIIDGGATGFTNYSTAQTLEILNAKRVKGEITDKAAFLDNLTTVRLVKLGNPSHYQIGDLGYTIKADTDEIKIYQKFVTVNGELYAIYQGNFEFLKSITFKADSGWLPWV